MNFFLGQAIHKISYTNRVPSRARNDDSSQERSQDEETSRIVNFRHLYDELHESNISSYVTFSTQRVSEALEDEYQREMLQHSSAAQKMQEYVSKEEKEKLQR